MHRRLLWKKARVIRPPAIFRGEAGSLEAILKRRSARIKETDFESFFMGFCERRDLPRSPDVETLNKFISSAFHGSNQHPATAFVGPKNWESFAFPFVFGESMIIKDVFEHFGVGRQGAIRSTLMIFSIRKELSFRTF
jgi:hypothetical protein